MAYITIDTTVKTEREAARSAIDIIKNPPKNPVEMIGWLSKNFSVTGDLAKSVTTAIPALGKFLPIAGEIFAAFSSLIAPSIGDQLAQMAQAIGSQIAAVAEDIKNAVAFSTEKTISAVITEVQGTSMDESAARVIQTLNESEIFAEADKVKAEIISAYGDELQAINQEWQQEIGAAINQAQNEVDALYAQIQDLLAELGLDLLQDIYNRLMDMQAEVSPAPAARAPAISAAATTPPASGSESNMTPLLVAGGLLAFILMQKKQRG